MSKKTVSKQSGRILHRQLDQRSSRFDGANRSLAGKRDAPTRSHDRGQIACQEILSLPRSVSWRFPPVL